MKVKKLVSLLLAVMLIVGMVPMNASAWLESSTADKGKMALMVGTEPPTTTKSKKVSEIYEKAVKEDGSIDTDTLASYATNIANKWDQKSETGTVSVGRGDTVYIGVKLGFTTLSTYKGVSEAAAFIQFDPDQTELTEKEVKDSILVNDINNGYLLQETMSATDDDDEYLFLNSMGKKITDNTAKSIAAQYDAATGYSSSTTTMTAERSTAGKTGDDVVSLLLKDGTGMKYATSPSAEWDVAIPLKIKSDATAQSTTVKLLSKLTTANGASNSLVAMSKTEMDWGTNITESTTTLYEGDIYTTCDTITINIVSNDPALKVDDANKTVGINNGGATLVVGINDKGTFNDDAATASNWVVKVGADTLTADTDYCVTKDSGTQLTFTLNSSANVTDGKTITVEQAGSAKVTTKTGETIAYDGSIGTATFTAKAAPVVTFDYSSQKLTTSESDAIEYKLNKDDATWATLETTGVVVTDSDLTVLVPQGENGAANTAKVADVRWKDATGITSSVSVKRAAQPADFTIGYDSEAITVNGTDLDTSDKIVYKIDDGSNNEVVGGETIKLTPGSSAQTLTYYVKANNTAGKEALASTEKTLTVPARPTVTVTTEDKDDCAIDGQSYVTVTTNPANLTVKGVKKDADTTLTKTDFDNASDLTTGAMDLTTAEYIHAYIPAGDANFASALTTGVQGKGNTYGTVVIPNSIAVGAKEIVVTLRGSTTGTVNTNTVIVKKGDDSNALSGYSVATGDDSKSIKITLPEKALANEVYHITVNSAALTNGTNGSTAATGDVTVSGNGVTVTVKDQNNRTLNTATFVEQGKTEVYDLTSALNEAGQYVKEGTFTSNYGTVTLNATAGSEELTFVANAAISGSQDATIIVTTYEVATVSAISNKTWDGTKDVSYDKATFKNKRNSSDSLGSVFSPLKDELKITLDEADVGSRTASWSEVADEESNVYIEAGSASVEVVAATVSAVSIDSSEVKVAPGKISEVAAELAKQEIVKVEAGSNEEAKFTTTLDKLLTTTQIESILLDQARQAAYTAKTAETEKAAEDEFYEAWKAEYIAAKNRETEGSGDALTEAALAAAYENETEYAKAGSNYVWANKDANIQTAKNNALTTLKTTLTTEITDASSVDNNTDLSFTLPFTGTFDSSLNVSASSSATFSNNVQNYNASSASLTVTAKAYKATSSGGGVYQPNIELETNGFGTADGVVELDEEYKITKLPGLTGQKLGTVFKGWATQKGNANTIVKNGREVTTDMTLYAIVEGYMSGDTANGKRVARPDDSVTREEMITMLVRAAGIYDASIDYTTTFADAKNRWSTSYIGCAETAGILAGDAEGTARPKDAITREEAAILIAKTFKVDVAIGGTTEYVTDFDEVSSWAADYVAAMVNNGTSVGYPVNGGYEFQASNEITRAEVAAMINKYIGLTEELKTSLAADETIESPFADVQNRKSWIYANMVFATLNAPATSYVTEITYPTR